MEQEQRGQANVVYIKQLIEQLSEDLSRQRDSGFSKRNLYKMRQFYLANKLVPAPAQLSWTQHVELLPVTNQADKHRLEQRIISEKLSPRQIRQEVHQLKKSQQAPQQDRTPVILPRPCREQPLQCYGLTAPDKLARSRGDCCSGLRILAGIAHGWRVPAPAAGRTLTRGGQ